MSKPRGPYRVDPLGHKKSQQALDKKAENARELGLDYEPIQCPICKAEDSPYPKCGCVTYVEQPAQQEPYGQVTVVRRPECVDQHWFYRWPEPPYLDNAIECHAVYTSPPAQRKPLTDEEIDELSRTMVKGDKSVNWLCRAIEAAHGIKENT